MLKTNKASTRYFNWDKINLDALCSLSLLPFLLHTVSYVMCKTQTGMRGN